MERRPIITWILILGIATSPVYSQYYSKTVPYDPKPEKITNLHFFFHDTLSGKDPSAVLVARANISSDDSALAPFSSVFAIDDPLTVGPELTSEVIGNARGLWVSSGKDIPTLVAFFDFGFTCWAAIDPIWWPAGAQIHYARPASGSPRGRTQNAPFGTCKATQNDVVWPGPSNFCLPL